MLSRGRKNNNLSYASTAIEQAPLYDTNITAILDGFARSGKGNIVGHMMRNYYYARFVRTGAPKSMAQVDDWLVEHNIAKNNGCYSELQDMQQMFSRVRGAPFFCDETYYQADKREWALKQHTATNHTLNTKAYLNNFYIDEIQNLGDIEFRHINNSNIVVSIVERGRALVHAAEHSFTIQRASYGFEKFEKEPNLLASLERGIYQLKRLRSYVHEWHWKPLDTCANCGHPKHPYDAERGDYDDCACGCRTYKCKNPFFAQVIHEKEYWHMQMDAKKNAAVAAADALAASKAQQVQAAPAVFRSGGLIL